MGRAKQQYKPRRRKELYHYYRQQAFEVLGGYRCSKCGFDDPRALQIDHIGNEGYLRRKCGEMGQALYQKVIREGGVGFQILCANCNWIKKAEFEGRSLEYYWINQLGEFPKRKHPLATDAKPGDTYKHFNTEVSMGEIASRFHMSRSTLRDWWVAEFGEVAVRDRCVRVQALAVSRMGSGRARG